MYLKYDEDLPKGSKGPEADQLASRMLEALNEEAYLNTDYIEWTYKGRRHYKWYKTDKTCEVSWDQITVILDVLFIIVILVFNKAFLNSALNYVCKI